jgi:peptidoglycan-associated lipoprotein
MLRAIPAIALLIGASTFTGCVKRANVSAKPPERTQPVETVAKSTPAPAQRTSSRAAVSPLAETPKGRMPDQKTLNRIEELLAKIQDAYFDYDKHSIRPDAEQALRTDAQTLSEIIRQYPDFKLVVQGYCDERGSDEYNIALGDARAKKAKDYLVTLGLPAGQMDTVSYGKQNQVCNESDENCWQKNRRAHLTIASNQSR